METGEGEAHTIKGIFLDTHVYGHYYNECHLLLQ